MVQQGNGISPPGFDSRLKQAEGKISMESDQTRAKKQAEFIDDVLAKVIHALDLGLNPKQRDLMIKRIIDVKDNEQNTLFDLIEKQALRIFIRFLLNVWHRYIEERDGSIK